MKKFEERKNRSSAQFLPVAAVARQLAVQLIDAHAERQRLSGREIHAGRLSGREIQRDTQRDTQTDRQTDREIQRDADRKVTDRNIRNYSSAEDHHGNAITDTEKSDSNGKEQHEKYMQMALQEAERVGRLSAPRIHGLGALWSLLMVTHFARCTREAGQPHAEVEAVHSAIIKLGGHVPERYTDEWWSAALAAFAGAAYVTLEPCHHSGKTPPCDHLLVKCGIAKVHVAVLDPDERVSGKGVSTCVIEALTSWDM